MTFLTIDQMKTHIHTGVRNAISNWDDSLVQDAIDSAIAEAMGYLSRYDTDKLFNVGDEGGFKADPMLLNSVKSIAKWNFMNIANPNVDYEDAQIRYDNAIKWLERIQSGKVVPKNWPAVTPNEKSQLWQVNSNTPKRNNRFGGGSNSSFNIPSY